MEQNGFGESDSDGACAKPPSKRIKGKSKVWDKVAWFGRKSRNHRESHLAEMSDIPAYEFEMEVDSNMSVLPITSDGPIVTVPPWGSSETSSSSEELSEHNDSQRKVKSYPNSEVVEQSCLKPSVARALFHQLELQATKNGDGPTITKTPWQKRKKKTQFRNYNYTLGHEYDYVTNYGTRQQIDSSSLKFSRVPSYILNDQTSKVTKHCSCCRSHRHNVNIDRTLSTRSLDRFSTKRITNIKPPKLGKSDSGRTVLINSKMQDNTRKTKNKCVEHISCNSPIYESTSLPNYFSKSLHDRGVQRWGSGRSHLPLCDSLFKRAVSSKVMVCECKKNEDNDPESETLQKDQIPEKDISKIPSPQEFRSKLKQMKTWFEEFSDEQKNLLLNKLLEDCELPQIHLLSLKMSPRLHEGCPPNCEDLITWLPQSLSLYIMSFLDPVTLCRASQVCSAWYQLANEPCLWRRLSCQRKWRLSCTGEQKQLLQHMLPNETVHWKRVFAERYKLRNNWLKGRCNVRTFEGHTQGISCVQFDDTRIVSGSSDKTIKVWNIRTNTPWSVQTLAGHSGTVRCLHLEGNRLVSGSTDKSIKVWDLSTQLSWSSIACKVTMIGHMDTVRCLQVDDEKVISGSYDKTLKIWDIRTGHSRRTLRGHDGAVLCVQFDSKKIISGSCDKTIKVWNFDGECMMTLHGHHDAVTCLQFDQTRIISGSIDSTLKFWDICTGQCMNTIDWKASEGHTGVVRCLQADSWRVVSASDDRTLKVWNITTGERLVTLRNHSDGVTCLQFNDNMIVSGSYDKTVKLWDFSCC